MSHTQEQGSVTGQGSEFPYPYPYPYVPIPVTHTGFSNPCHSLTTLAPLHTEVLKSDTVVCVANDHFHSQSTAGQIPVI